MKKNKYILRPLKNFDFEKSEIAAASRRPRNDIKTHTLSLRGAQRRSNLGFFRGLILLLFALPLVLRCSIANAETQEEIQREYKVKAACLYNFLKFVEWPKENRASAEEITIGILGQSQFGDAFGPVLNQSLKGKKLVVKNFDKFEKNAENIEALKKCDILFICVSEDKSLAEILSEMKDADTLTVGETNGFLETGGIINFVIDNKKVGFDINVANARKAGLEIRSQLLRLARKVIDEDDKSKKQAELAQRKFDALKG